jgi:hypothetical protein
VQSGGREELPAEFCLTFHTQFFSIYFVEISERLNPGKHLSLPTGILSPGNRDPGDMDLGDSRYRDPWG